jgi:hypothetical protein
MLALDELDDRAGGSELAPHAGAGETAFYAHYGWCLNPQLDVAQAAARLRDELQRLSAFSSGWQRREIAINIWLLASGILNAADERLRGKTVRIAKLRRLAAPLERVAAQSARGLLSAAGVSSGSRASKACFHCCWASRRRRAFPTCCPPRCRRPWPERRWACRRHSSGST